MIETDGLLIKNVNQEDAGTYTCRARVLETGSLEERDIKLEVRQKRRAFQSVLAAYVCASRLFVTRNPYLRPAQT